jgi:hypothetical protein
MNEKKAIEITKKYIEGRKRTYVRIVEERVLFSNERVIHGKYIDEIRDIWVVSYENEGFDGPINNFVVIDDLTEEVLFTVTSSGYAEDWEEDITEQ